MKIDDLIEAYGAALREQAASNAELAAAEDTAKIILAECLANEQAPEWKAEAAARSSSAYKAAIVNVHQARERAEKARAEVEYLRARFEAWRSKSSMAKAMRQLEGR